MVKKMVINILDNPVYTGITIAKKYKKISPLSKKSIITDKSEWIIVKNTHEPIITEDIFDKIQNLKKRKAKRKTAMLDLIKRFIAQICSFAVIVDVCWIFVAKKILNFFVKITIITGILFVKIIQTYRKQD